MVGHELKDSSVAPFRARSPEVVYVVSTDIKKSSKLWAWEDGGVWMKNHIVLHHAIVQSWAIDHGFSILPNSPEGDAFVMYKKASPSAEQSERVKRTMLAYAENLQHRFTMCRETTASGAPGALLIPGAEKLPDFKGQDGKPKQPGIYIRVGVASGKVHSIAGNWKPYRNYDSWLSRSF